jgi:hypothetical protein
MENSILKTGKRSEAGKQKSGKNRKLISEEDIRRRAFEIFKENGGTPHNELDDWFRAERELKGTD